MLPKFGPRQSVRGASRFRRILLFEVDSELASAGRGCEDARGAEERALRVRAAVAPLEAEAPPAFSFRFPP